MNIDVETLLAPLSGGSPCGDDIEYDPDFVELETLAKGKEELQVGDARIAAEEPDWKLVSEKAVGLLGKAKDLRVANILASAVLRLEGPVAFAQVLGYIRGCLETYWSHVHPMLDADDDNDPTARVNAMGGFAAGSFGGEGAVLKALRLAPLTESRAFGRFSLRDILVADGEMPLPAGMDKKPDPASISAAFQDTAADRRAALKAALADCRLHVKVIRTVFDTETGSRGPDFTPLDKMLHRIQQAMEAYAGQDASAAAEADAAAEAGGAEPGTIAESTAASVTAAPRAVPAAQAIGGISGPDDVIRTLDRICEYYEKREPSSPVPLLLKRARRLVNADFTTIIRDMARSGMDQVRTVTGLRDDDDD